MKTVNHIFQHLGKAPYQLVHTGEGETACDYCGTYIRNVFVCKGSDGKEFVLGSSCVEKLGDQGLVKQVKEAVKEKNAVKRREKWAEQEAIWRLSREVEEANRIAERNKQIQAVKAEYSQKLEILKTTPHPNSYFASKGKTMLDYLDYFRADIFKPIEEQSDDWWYHGKVNQVLRSL